MRPILLFSILIIISNIVQAQDGSFDASFDLDGQLVTDINGGYEFCNDLIVLPDDKIISIGTSGSDIALVKYDVNGILESTYGNNGIKLLTISGGPNPAKAILQSDGSIIIYGNFTNIFPTELFILRIDSNGNLDNSFGTNGIVTTNFGNDGQYPGGIKLQSDGKIIISGTTENFSPLNSDIIVMRLNSNGSLDNTFGTNGQIIINVDLLDGSQTLDYGIDILFRDDGKIIVIGSSDISGNKIVLIRLNSNGTIDSSFGSSGLVVEMFNTNFDAWTCSALQSDNKIIIGGQSNDGNNDVFALARFEENGAYDNTFGSSGKVMNSVDNYSSYGKDILIQNDGKIILIGSVIDNTFNYAFAISRYNSDGTLDTSFDTDGTKSFTFNSSFPPNDANAVATQSSGKILIAGIVNNNSDNDIGIARIISSQNSFGISVSLKIYLEGSFNGVSLNSLLDLSQQLSHPYPASIHSGSESVSSEFFSSHTDIVDWVIVELRTNSDAASKVATRAAFLKEDGSIVDLDGISDVYFEGINSVNSHYIVIHQRNHISIMSSNPIGI